ncbi:MAG: recombinase family protein, partial [Clostridia bacterium]|nr:recombinase family protein [Clostridia bacterium]
MENRVYCLYRVSTDKQVDYNDKSQADIPMQRKACHRFADEKGWSIIHEEQEDGVSGHKVRAENRDKLQIIKEHAKQGKFDILLVFMFDRIGRIADETPFVVEWFVKNGIRVWSTQEGEQRFDNHTDKLTNYIRFWQADGESEKTSIRTKTALGQLVEGGGFKGGKAPFGYDLVKSGRLNKRKHEVHELAVNEDEASVVRIIFDMYVHEGYGPQRITSYLNGLGYRARTGKMWHHASIRGIIGNLTYTGVLRSGESRSQVLPHLQIIEPELFETAQRIRASRGNAVEKERTVPLNTRGNSLLAGNVFCGHCGARLSLTTSGRFYPCKDDPTRIVKRVRYVCYGKTRKQTECDGQTGYTVHILDGIIEKIVRRIFERMKAIPKSEIVNVRYREKMEERKALLASVRANYTKATAELDMLKAEVIKALRGESAFTKELLSSMISESEAKCAELQSLFAEAQTAYNEGQAVLKSLNEQYDDIISWSEMYDTASIEARKMIVNCLISRVEV